METFRKAVSSEDIIPTGQLVLIETISYTSEKGIASGDKEFATFPIHRVIGYGGMTIEVELGDIVSITNGQDYRMLNLFNANNTDNITKLYNSIKRPKGSIKQQIEFANKQEDTTYVDILARDNYIRVQDYGLINETNVLFRTNIELIRKRLVEFLLKYNIAIEKLEVLKDDILTDEVIATYKSRLE